MRLSHRAEVGVDVIKRLLHTLADADVSDRDFRLAADDQLDVRAAEFCSGKGEALRDLYSAVYRAVGADTEIQMLSRWIFIPVPPKAPSSREESKANTSSFVLGRLIVSSSEPTR